MNQNIFSNQKGEKNTGQLQKLQVCEMVDRTDSW